MLITDSKCPARFSSVLVNPVALRSVEQMALLHRKPEVYLLNKVSSLLFTEEEFRQASGVKSLDSLKQAALRGESVINYIISKPHIEFMPY